MKKLISGNIGNIVITLILLLFSLWAGRGLFKYSAYSTHDGLHHIARSYDAIETFNEGHFPLRWAGSLNYKCGIPIFNFFYPLFYYLIILFSKLSIDVIFSIKLIGLFSLIIGTIFFYYWMKVETASKVSALGGAILYLFAPYRFSLILVRGSPEYLAYAVLPVILLFYSLAFKNWKTRKYLPYLFLATIFGGLLTISHNFTVMFLVPLIFCYLILKMVRVRAFGISKILLLLFSYLSIVGLGAFFIFPALIEERFTQIGLNAGIVYSEHFPELWQLFKSKWNYFYSSGGTEFDGMSFMLGYAQWLVLLLFVVWMGAYVWNKQRNRRFGSNNPWILFFGLGSLFTVFLMLEKSNFVWKAIPILQQIQFPWRLLGVAVFTISVLFSFLLTNIKKRSLALLIFVFISVIAVVGNRNHLLPMPISEEDIWMFDDFNKLHYHRYSTTTMGDDVIARNADQRCAFTDPEITLSGEKIEHQVVKKGNTYGTIRFNSSLKGMVDGKYVLKLSYFPSTYNLTLDGEKVSYEDCSGRVCIVSGVARDGYNIVSWKIVQTPLEKTFNVVTIATFVFWLLLLIAHGFGMDKRNLIRFIFTVLVIFVYCFFRFYNLPQKFGFDWDAERDANVVKDIINGKFTLIGPRVLGPSGFFLPPYFYYLLTPFYWITKLDPRAILYFLYAYNILFLTVALFVLSKIFSHKLALVFVAVLAVVPYAISMDTVSWNPILIPLVFLFFLYLLHKYELSGNVKWLFFSAVCFSLGVSFHVQFAFYGLFFLPVFYKSYRKIKKILLVALGVILPFFPLLLFDVRHEFINLRLLAGMVGGVGVRDNFQILTVWSNFLTMVLNVTFSNTAGIVCYLTVVLFLSGYVSITKQWRNNVWLGILLTWLSFPIVFYVYGKRPSEYYFNFLIPLIMILVSSVIVELISNRLVKIKIFGLVLLMIIFFHYFPAIMNQIKYVSPKSYYNKEKTVSLLKLLTTDSPPFGLSYSVLLGEDVGFRYMMDYSKIMYSNKSSDTLIQLTYPANYREDTFTTGVYGLKIPETWLNESLRIE